MSPGDDQAPTLPPAYVKEILLYETTCRMHENTRIDPGLYVEMNSLSRWSQAIVGVIRRSEVSRQRRITDIRWDETWDET